MKIMQRIEWTDRKFNFESSVGILPGILERLRGTSSRMKEISTVLTNEEAVQKPGNKWSIKEHIGHLTDLESLHQDRIDDFIQRKGILRAADMTNVKTHCANHNREDIRVLIKRFTENRAKFVSRLEELDDETQHFKSLHPRLQVFMLPVDHAYFVAEHDDHHLVSIRDICKKIYKQ